MNWLHCMFNLIFYDQSNLIKGEQITSRINAHVWNTLNRANVIQGTNATLYVSWMFNYSENLAPLYNIYCVKVYKKVIFEFGISMEKTWNYSFGCKWAFVERFDLDPCPVWISRFKIILKLAKDRIWLGRVWYFF